MARLSVGEQETGKLSQRMRRNRKKRTDCPPNLPTGMEMNKNVLTGACG